MWEGLLVFLADGRVEWERSGHSQPQAARRASVARQIDNNEVENAIRPTAVGKKNWLFIGDAEAGERGTIVFTIIEACRRRGIDPFDYLRDVFTRMPEMELKDYPTFVPATWAAARQPAIPTSKAPASAKATSDQRRWA